MPHIIITIMDIMPHIIITIMPHIIITIMPHIILTIMPHIIRDRSLETCRGVPDSWGWEGGVE